MVTNTYIDAFVRSKESAFVQEKARREQVEAKLPEFVERCRVWLGALWDEIEPMDASVKWDGPHSGAVHHYNFPFIWNRIWGNICEENYLSGCSNEANLEIKTGNWRKLYGLDIAIDGSAIPMKAERIGEALYLAIKMRDGFEESERKRIVNRKTRLEDDFKNSWISEEDVKIDEHLRLCLREFPEEIERWEKAASLSRSALEERRDKEESERLETERLEKEMNGEEEKLQERVVREFPPSVVYKVIYGDGGDDSETHGYLNELSTVHKADKSGWWWVIKNGTLIRKKLANVISVEEIRITSPYHPYTRQAYRAERIKSLKYPNVTAELFLLPE